MNSSNNKPSFGLKKPTNENLFMPTAEIDLTSRGECIVNISTDKLEHYHNHPFKLYTDERLEDMVESIKANGILMPLLVRPFSPADNSEHLYEVLAGHNRLEGSKLAGLSEVPCIVKTDLTDEEAHLIVTESNLIQRSFTDLSHSERAEALANHYNAIKHQGKRTDLIRQVEALLNGDTDYKSESLVSDSDTGAPAGKKSIEVTGEKYGLSKNSVARYVRVNDLIAGFKELMDSEMLSIRAGVSLSYLSETRQLTVLSQLAKYETTSVSMKQAEQIRSLNAELSEYADDNGEEFLLGCADILVGRIETDNIPKPSKTISFKLDRQAVASYFKEDDTEKAIQETVLQALAFYHQHYARYKDAVNEQ